MLTALLVHALNSNAKQLNANNQFAFNNTLQISY